jgi:hypothetical protein
MQKTEGGATPTCQHAMVVTEHTWQRLKGNKRMQSNTKMSTGCPACNARGCTSPVVVRRTWQLASGCDGNEAKAEQHQIVNRLPSIP